MIKLKWSDFLNPEKKIAINCQTEAEAKEFLQMLDGKGVIWASGKKPTFSTFFDDTKEKTTYRVVNSNCLAYMHKSYYCSIGYTVYRYSEVEFVDDKPKKVQTVEKKQDPKADALYNIVKAMTEIRCSLENECDPVNAAVYAACMKALAEAFEIVSRTEDNHAE